MELTEREQDGVTIVTIDGELDADANHQLTPFLDDLLAGGRRNFVVDLEHVGFVDSLGLAELVRLLKHVRTGSGGVYLASMQPVVEKVMEMTQLDHVFDLHPDVEAAVQAFNSREPGGLLIKIALMHRHSPAGSGSCRSLAR